MIIRIALAAALAGLLAACSTNATGEAGDGDLTITERNVTDPGSENNDL
ncbi:hypothetical protein [Tropicimonas sp. IMCC34011]|nr:hypothetical protein [Tropicimonas sp. IMCC34011]